MLHKELINNPGMRVAVVRPTYKSVKENIIPQWRDKILRYGFDYHINNPILRPIGGPERVEQLLYHNGSRMIFGGMDDPGKILGGEFDIIFYNQVEQGKEEDWEVLWSRLRWGKWNHPIFGFDTKLLIGDCNPSRRKHWVPNRADQGKTLLCYVYLDSNPQLHYNGEWTEEGTAYRESCKLRYSGLRLRRGLFGEWCSPDGLVYEFDPAVHEVELLSGDIPSDWEWSASIDHGSTHPFVYQLYCGPKDRSKIYLYKEIYKPGLDTEEMKQIVGQLQKQHLPKDKDLEWTVADHREDINKTLSKLGYPITRATKEVLDGIDNVKVCLRDGRILFNKHSLFHDPDRERNEKSLPVKTVEEFDRYSYKEEDKMDGSEKDEYPIKAFDDGMDTLRYEIAEWYKDPINLYTGIIDSASPPVRTTFF